MAKIFITSSNDVSKELHESCTGQGFKHSFVESLFEVNILSFYKKNSNDRNFFHHNGRYIVVVGSSIYNNNIKGKALESILNDFQTPQDIYELRKRIIGNYVILIRHSDDKLYIFNDINHSILLFYYYNRNVVHMGSDLYDLVQSVVPSFDINIDRNSFLEGVFQNAILGNRTNFVEFQKLLGHQFIVINPDLGLFEVLESTNVEKFSLNLATRETQIRDYANLLMSYIGLVAKHFQKIGLFMTGGLDSRIMLAGFLRAGVKPKLYYGIGNSALMNTKDEDLSIVKELARSFDLDLVILNWSSPHPVDQYWQELGNKFGFFSDLYSGNINFINSIEQLQDIEFLEFGYMGESLRNNKWMDLLKQNEIMPDELVNIYLSKYNVGVLGEMREVSRNVYTELCAILSRNDINTITRNEYQVFDNEYRKLADSEMLRFVNHYYYSVAIGGQYELLNFTARIPYEYKINNSFSLDVIKFIYPRLLNIPIYSHGNMMSSDLLDGYNNEKFKNIKFFTFILSELKKFRLFHQALLTIKFICFPYFDNERYSLNQRGTFIKKYLRKKYGVDKLDDLKSLAYVSSPYVARYYQMLTLLSRLLNKSN